MLGKYGWQELRDERGELKEVLHHRWDGGCEIRSPKGELLYVIDKDGYIRTPQGRLVGYLTHPFWGKIEVRDEIGVLQGIIDLEDGTYRDIVGRLIGRFVKGGR